MPTLMLYPDDLSVAFKEWDSVCAALLQGRQTILLRKGGIHESNSEFEVEFRRFLLYPTLLHQAPNLLKGDAQDLLKLGGEPTRVSLEVFVDVSDIYRIESDRQLQAIQTRHIWSEEMVQKRLDYRPENALFLLVVRAHRLPTPTIIGNRPQYVGCTHWIGLRESVNVKGATPVLDDAAYKEQRDDLMMRLRSAG